MYQDALFANLNNDLIVSTDQIKENLIKEILSGLS
jgi:hypothetical protein